MPNFRERANHIWSIADLLRGRYKQSDYGKVILPFTVLRRLDIVLEPTKQRVLDEFERQKALAKKDKDKNKNVNPEILEPVLNRISGLGFHNRSKLNFDELVKDYNQIGQNLRSYINGFSTDAKDIFVEHFKFEDQIQKLEKFDLLFKVVSEFNEHRHLFAEVDSIEMGYTFEELIRRFAESSNETAGEHFTPREVIKLMVNLLFREDRSDLTRKNIVKTLYDPACGTGGMLAVAEEYLKKLNPDARLELFGQEMNPESYAICKSDMLIKGHNIANLKFGDTFREDRLPNNKFDYFLSNPPFGVDWKVAEDEVKREHSTRGNSGRFGAGLPPISDGSLLFLQHQISKMKTAAKGGSRLAIVFNGSPLFSGGAGSGPSNIRRWIIENDWLEAIVAMPDQLFYNTGISTYVWVVTTDKEANRRGKVQLVNANGADGGDKGNLFYVRMLRSLGDKRKEMGDGEDGKPDQIGYVTELFFDFEENEYCKIFDNHYFGYWRITVERPLRLNFQMSEERVARIQDVYDRADREYRRTVDEITNERQRQNQELAALHKFERDRVFTQEQLDELKETTENFGDAKLYKDRAVFLPVFAKAIADLEFTLSARQKKLVLDLLSERDQTAEICRDRNGDAEPDTELRDYENIPLREIPQKDSSGEDAIDRDTIEEYFACEVLPHVADAWIDWDKTKVGYEINFTKYFYKYKPLRNLDDIRRDILALERETEGMIKQVVDK